MQSTYTGPPAFCTKHYKIYCSGFHWLDGNHTQSLVLVTLNFSQAHLTGYEFNAVATHMSDLQAAAGHAAPLCMGSRALTEAIAMRQHPADAVNSVCLCV
jgi:hypothetical protein